MDRNGQIVVTIDGEEYVLDTEDANELLRDIDETLSQLDAVGTSRIERLERAAQEHWGTAWTINIKRWADGSRDAYAFQSRGRNEEGNLVRERLFLRDDGSIRADLVQLENREIETTDMGEIEVDTDE